jgi:hypothetical protein
MIEAQTVQADQGTLQVRARSSGELRLKVP